MSKYHPTFFTDFLTFCLKFSYHSFESSIWTLCTYYRDLRTSQIDSPRKSEHFSFFKRPTRTYIAFCRSQNIRYDCQKSTRLFQSLVIPVPQNKNKFMTHISGFFKGTKFRCAQTGYMRFPKRTKMSQIDSSRDCVYFSILNHQKQPGIEYFTIKLS